MTYEKDIPDFALVPAKQPEERVRTPITQGAIYTPVQVTNITERERTVIHAEEDLLVPDTRPDLKEILDISGKIHLASYELGPFSKAEDAVPLAGEIDLQTLYIPEKTAVCGPVISTSSRISFRETWHIAAAEGTILTLDAQIEKIDYMVINERKYRVKIQIAITARECRDVRLEFFEGLAGEEIQTLRDTVEITSIALRKKDIFTVHETLHLKDGTPPPETILKQEISVVENYRQAAAEKVIINGFIYVDLLCASPAAATGPEDSRLGRDTDGGAASPAASPEAAYADASILYPLQERVEFTQFIPLSENGQWSGCHITFDSSDLRMKLAAGEDGTEALRLEGDIITWLELYRNTEKEIITDGYHRQKDFVCEFEETGCRTLTGTAVGETTVREILPLDTGYGDAERILSVSGTITGGSSHAEPGKIITEGTLSGKILCLGADGCVFGVSHDLPFRCVTAAPYVQGGEIIRHKLYRKEIWAEKINGKQAELNAGILVSIEIMQPVPLRLLKNPAFEESPGRSLPSKPMAVYIVKEGDSLWSIAKQFQSTMDSIRQTNQMDETPLHPGQKLLILK